MYARDVPTLYVDQRDSGNSGCYRGETLEALTLQTHVLDNDCLSDFVNVKGCEHVLNLCQRPLRALIGMKWLTP